MATRGLSLASRAASRRALTQYPPLVVQQLQSMEQDLGGRGELVGMLTLAPLTPDLEYILGLLGDPAHNRESLADICAAAGILPGDLLKHLQQAALLRGKVLAAQAVGNGIAAVVKDVMRKAAPYEDACSTCMGVGQVTPEPTNTTPNPSPETCETCRGTGRLMYQPKLEHQQMAIDMAQLIPKSGGINIANINQPGGPGGGGTGGGSISGALTSIQRLTDQALYGKTLPGADRYLEAADEPETVEGELAPDVPPDTPSQDPSQDPSGEA